MNEFFHNMFSFIDVGGWFDAGIEWLTDNVSWLFDGIRAVLDATLTGFETALSWPYPLIVIAVLVAIAYFAAHKGVAIFTVLGFLLIVQMGLWEDTMATLALVIGSVVVALIIGLPLGIWCSKSDTAERIVRPILDFMQTLPAFVYLIPAVKFFSLGKVPGAIATLIFSLPPAVRLTNLGIRQVPTEIREAALSFGSTPRQLLFKAELPSALPTPMAGVDQTIMLALSMVVVAGMIGAGGLGNVVLKGIQQLQIDLGFEGGIAIVILAVYLDRVTQALAHKRDNS
jgi:glycine betaine/proline transport system permease protein